MVAAYAVPAAAVWLTLGLAIGLVLAALPIAWAGPAALAAVAAYGACYGLAEVSGRSGPPPPGRRWQVPQTMLIDASPRRRVLVWGATLGPGFATRNPYAGFGALPLAVASMRGPVPGLALGAAMGAAHGAARAAGLLRDVRELRAVPAASAAPAALPASAALTAPAALAVTATPTAGAGGGTMPGGAVPTHIDLLLKTLYWRRADGALLLALAVAAGAAAVGQFT